MTTLDDGVSEWLTGVMGLVITDWETDFRDGYKFGQILLKLEVLDDDDDEDEYRFEPVGLWIRRSSKEIVVDDNYGYVRTALEDINIELTENGVQLLKAGTLNELYRLLNELYAYSQTLSANSGEHLHKRMSTMVRHSQTYGHGLLEALQTEMMSNPLHAQAQPESGGAVSGDSDSPEKPAAEASAEEEQEEDGEQDQQQVQDNEQEEEEEEEEQQQDDGEEQYYAWDGDVEEEENDEEEEEEEEPIPIIKPSEYPKFYPKLKEFIKSAAGLGLDKYKDASHQNGPFGLESLGALYMVDCKKLCRKVFNEQRAADQTKPNEVDGVGGEVLQQNIQVPDPFDAYWDSEERLAKKRLELLVNVVDEEDKLKCNALNVAIRNGKKAAVEILLNLGARTEVEDFSGRKPLRLCLEKCWPEKDGLKTAFGIMKSLLTKKANVNGVDFIGWTPLHAAVAWRRQPAKSPEEPPAGASDKAEKQVDEEMNFVKKLLQAGANVNAVDMNGVTPIFLVNPGEPEVLELLVSHGANMYHRDNKGYDCLYRFKDQGKKGLVTKLTEDGLKMEPGSKGMKYLYQEDGRRVQMPSKIEMKDSTGKQLLFKTESKTEGKTEENVFVRMCDRGHPSFPIDDFFVKSKETSSSESELDEMKIVTMFKMVDECRVIAQGKDVVKKVVFLTNKQAAKFDESMMSNFLKTIDIGEPKFVIKLIDSEGIASQMQAAHPELADQPESLFGDSTFNSSEISEADERVVEQQIMLFMKHVLLPLAIQTHALIIVSGSNDCYLTAALARVALAEQARFGKNCPFTVIASVSEKVVHARAVSPKPEDAKSIAQQIARSSPTWAKKANTLNEFYSAKYMPLDQDLPLCDLTDAAEVYIIFDSYDPPTAVNGVKSKDGYYYGAEYNLGPSKNFQSCLLQHLTRNLPCIAISALSPIHGLPFVIDLANRGVNILMLDTAERAFTLGLNRRRKDLQTMIAKESEAFPDVDGEIAELVFEGLDQLQDGSIPLETRKKLVDIAIEMAERRMKAFSRYGVIDQLVMSMIAFFHAVLQCGSDIDKAAKNGDLPQLYKKLQELEKIERTNSDANGGVPPELLMRVMDWISIKYPSHKLQCHVKKLENWLQSHPSKYKRLVPNANGWLFDKESKAKEIFEKHQGRWNGSGLPANANYEFSQETWSVISDLIVSPHVYSASIFDRVEAKNILSTVAKINRLHPTTLQGMRILVDAWDHIETYHQMANVYKLITKVCYILLLVAATVITFMTILQSNTGLAAKNIIVGLGFGASFLTSYVATVNPAIKWQSLRMAALAMESNIWVFRTRAGIYRVSEAEAANNEDDKLLAESIKEIKEGVLQGADVKSTNFYSQTTSQNIHGQHPGGSSASFGALDNYSSNEKKSWFAKNFPWLVANLSTLVAILLPAGVAGSAAKASSVLAQASDKLKDARRKTSSFKIQADGKLNDVGAKAGNVLSSMKDLESGQAGGEGLASVASAGAERASSPLHVQPRIIASQDYREPGLCKGSRIEGRRGDFWYPGEISRFREDGNYDIYYDDDDDDDEQICIRKDHIRLRLVKGTVVKVDRSRYDESDNWKIGEISRVSGDASTFDIDYDDGGKEMQVDRDRIRLPAPALADVLKELDNEKKDWEEVEFDHKDCHYEPLTPDLYIRFRILPLIAFYKQRIPERTKIKSATQVIMIGGSVFVVILGFMDWTSWAAAVTIVTSSITAYMEFSGTDSKISRYSGAVHSLQELVQWWQTLPQIDRNVVVNIDRLILNCEEILSREQQAWKSTSQSAKMLKKASEAASGGGNDKEKEE